MYRFAISARWLGGLLGCVVVAAIMVGLGMWQLDRLDDRKARNAAVEAAQQAPPSPIGDLLPTKVTQRPQPSAEWRSVETTGRYDESAQVLVRGRTLDGEVGFEVLTPLVTTGGRAVLVDRGWIAAPEQDATAQPDVPAPPSGEVDVVGRVRPSEDYGAAKVAHGEGMPTVRIIDVPALADVVGHPLYGGYLQLVSEDPAVGAAPEPIPLPELDEGPHQSYAIQWFIFAAMTLGGFVVFLRREAERRITDKTELSDDPGQPDRLELRSSDRDPTRVSPSTANEGPQ